MGCGGLYFFFWPKIKQILEDTSVARIRVVSTCVNLVMEVSK